MRWLKDHAKGRPTQVDSQKPGPRQPPRNIKTLSLTTYSNVLWFRVHVGRDGTSTWTFHPCARDSKTTRSCMNDQTVRHRVPLVLLCPDVPDGPVRRVSSSQWLCLLGVPSPTSNLILTFVMRDYHHCTLLLYFDNAVLAAELALRY